jgi:hypothetical protein
MPFALPSYFLEGVFADRNVCLSLARLSVARLSACCLFVAHLSTACLLIARLPLAHLFTALLSFAARGRQHLDSLRVLLLWRVTALFQKEVFLSLLLPIACISHLR